MCPICHMPWLRSPFTLEDKCIPQFVNGYYLFSLSSEIGQFAFAVPFRSDRIFSCSVVWCGAVFYFTFSFYSFPFSFLVAASCSSFSFFFQLNPLSWCCPVARDEWWILILNPFFIVSAFVVLLLATRTKFKTI